ncbi:MAG TPA: efflux RND transporter periplasmic adaptor subunit [Thermoanaerobaculia bacterium]|nr:efflux RND transporter periplasmic adaptor subunit [Thermoanaerobaculia bacterium]
MEPLENNHKHRRVLLTAIVVALGVLIGLFFLRRGRDDGGDQYRTEAASRGDITATATATGTLSAVTTVQVGSQVSGIISSLYADFNSQVKQGQLLAELDPTPFLQSVEQRQAEVARAGVEVANAKVTYTRQKRLADAGLISLADLDAAKAAYNSAQASLALTQASLKQAQTNLGYAKIYSPVDGQVVARQYDVGQTVAASFSAPTLFTIAKDLTKMQVQADIDQSDIGRIKTGAPVSFTVDAYPDQRFEARVSQVRLNATVNQNVITYPVIIEVANPELKLRPSMTADVTIQVDTVRNVLRVPNSALRFRPPAEEGQEKDGAAAASPRGGGAARQGRQAGQTIYVLEGGKDKAKSALREVRVRAGLTDGRHTQVSEVLSGELKPGDNVVTGLTTLKVEASGNAAGRQGRMGAPMGRF